MNRDFKKQLRNTLDNLPEFSPDDKIWERIDDQLNFQEQLKVACRNLPVYEPRENIWQNIENKLGTRKTVKLFPVVMRYLSIAAGIAVILVVSLTVTRGNREKITKTVEIAELNFAIKPNDSDKTTDQAVSFIDAQCKSSSYLCEVPEFHQKQQQLDEVNNELKKVNKVMETLGDSQSLVQTKTKLENIKAQLIKDLVKQVTS